MSKYFLCLIILIHIFIHLPLSFSPPSWEHMWRECCTAAVARNFYEESANILLPRVDERGNTNGITGMEFPLYQYLLFLIYKIFGVKDFLGRWLSLLFSIIAIIFFFKWLKQNFEKQVILISSLSFVFSCSFFVYSCKTMPEMLPLCLHICTLYISWKYFFENKSKIFLLLSIFLLALAILSRPFHFILLLFLLFYKKELIKKFSFLFLFFFSLLPAFLWYFLYVPWLVDKNKLYSYFMGIGIGEAFTQFFKITIIKDFLFLIKKISQNLLNWGITSLLVFSILNIKKLRKSRILKICLLTIFSFWFFMTLKVPIKHQGNHEYYFLPILPYISLLLGIAIHKLNIKKISLIILIITIPLFTTKIHFYTKDKELSQMQELYKKTSGIIPKGSLVAVNDYGRPIMLYFLHLKGWSLGEDEMIDKLKVKELRDKGLKFLIFYKPHHSEEFIKNTFRNHNVYIFSKERIYIVSFER